MRISKKFAKTFIRVAEKAFNACHYSFEVFIGDEKFQVNTVSCSILREKTKDTFNSCRTYKDCVDWFFLRFSISELRGAKVTLSY